jgi:hypothetical protein
VSYGLYELIVSTMTERQFRRSIAKYVSRQSSARMFLPLLNRPMAVGCDVVRRMGEGRSVHGL